VTHAPDPIDALTADADEVDRMVAGLAPAEWETSTPAPGWTVAHQIAHLTATFKLAAAAAGTPEMFKKIVASLSPDFDANVRAAMAPYLSQPPDQLLQSWRAELNASAKALRAVPADSVVPWLVRPLPPAVLAAAGMMELFGHGQDIADGLGIERTYTDRICFLVAFAVRTWDFGYQARGLPTPDVSIRFELTAPSGALWTFGPEESDQRVTGRGADFCLLVTRRRHRDDLALSATGDIADGWLDIAQAYRGPAGEGRKPGQFAALSS
jgi:uncharacterized protein (TIGR03084 family)